jgi:hypothetical protein
VLIHAMYIFIVMRSGETRWTWYYTNWILLASILLARVMSLIFLGRGARWQAPILTPSLRTALGFLALGALLLAWFPLSYKRFAHLIPSALADGYQENLSTRLHLKTVIAFDKPGRMAFFTDVRVVPLDGLMGDLGFQRELASKGIAAFDAEHDVTAFVGPPQPLNANLKAAMCDSVYLGSTQFHCVQTAPDAWIVDRVEVFSRLKGASAGSIYLDPKNLVWNRSDQVGVWLISPNPSEQPPFVAHQARL